MNYFLLYLTLFILFTLFDSILFFFALFDSVLLSFSIWFYLIIFELDWRCQTLFWLFNMFDSYYTILFNYLWIGLNTSISVWLCLTHAVMHKFCACYRKSKNNLKESWKSQGPFEGPCRVHRRTKVGHGSYGCRLLCPQSWLVFFCCLECKIIAITRLSSIES